MITDLSTIPSGKIALYGFGAAGRFLFETMRRERPDLQVTCIADDAKSGEIYENIVICSVDQLALKHKVFDRIFVTGMAWHAMSAKLDTYGFQNKYEPVDILRGSASTFEMKVFLDNGSMRLATPNRLSAIVAERFFDIEPNTISWINTFTPGACFYDVGASNGLFSLYASISRNCSIVAFEPDALNFGLMSKNRVLNLDKIQNPFIALQLALANRSALIDLTSPDLPYEGAHGKCNSSNQRASQIEWGSWYIQPCLADKLDSLVECYKLPKPNYLKIDVDGAEFAVLEGANTILKTDELRQALVETEDVLEPRLSNFMKNFGYILLEAHPIYEMVGGQVQGVSNYLYGRL